MPAGGFALHADDLLPAPLPASRYEKMSNHSPFAPPTVTTAAVAAPAAPAAGWTDKFVVTLLMQRGKTYFATVLDKGTSEHFLVNSENENEHGLLLSSVQWADNYAQTRVTLKRGTEFGQVAFDPNASSASSFAAQPATGVPMPGMPSSAPFPSGNRPTLPGGMFHPPPGQNGSSAVNSAAPVRRPLIRANPAVQPPHTAPVPVPGKAAADDDDDD